MKDINIRFEVHESLIDHIIEYVIYNDKVIGSIRQCNDCFYVKFISKFTYLEIIMNHEFDKHTSIDELEEDIIYTFEEVYKSIKEYE